MPERACTEREPDDRIGGEAIAVSLTRVAVVRGVNCSSSWRPVFWRDHICQNLICSDNLATDWPLVRQ